MGWHQEGQIHVSWGPEGEGLTPAEKEARAAELLASGRKRSEEHERARKALEGLPYIAIPIDQLERLYERMKVLTRLGQTSINEFESQSDEISALKRKIFEQADMGAVYAGQWLPRESRDRIIERVRELP